MYYIYLYSNIDFRRGGDNYGYWTGKSYVVQGQEYPIVETKTNQCKRKEYKGLKRAISGGEIAYEKYAYVCGFDIEDENENVVYQSHKCYKNTSKSEIPILVNKNEAEEKSEVSTPTLDKWSEYQDYIQDGKFDIEEQYKDLVLYQYFDTLQWGYRYAIVLNDYIIRISENYPYDVMYGAEQVYKILKGL